MKTIFADGEECVLRFVFGDCGLLVGTGCICKCICRHEHRSPKLGTGGIEFLP